MPQHARGTQSAPAAQNDRLGVFTIIERDNAKPFWRSIGSAFQNRDGSLNVYLDALPVNGRINIRKPDRAGEGEREPSREPARDYRD